jgi:hypothetical protein
MIDHDTTFVTENHTCLKLSLGGPLKIGGPGHVPSVPVGEDGPACATKLKQNGRGYFKGWLIQLFYEPMKLRHT